MRTKWEYGIVYIDQQSGFLRPDTLTLTMSDVNSLASADAAGTFGQAEYLGIAGRLGWELVCPIEDSLNNKYWIFKRVIEH
jgi:hypothetical protein